MSDKQLQMYRGMKIIEEEYSASGLTDSEFAEQYSGEGQGKMSMAQVRQWRQYLGIPSNTKSSRVTAEQVRTLRKFVQEYLTLLESGDCGNSLPEDTDPIRAILEETK